MALRMFLRSGTTRGAAARLTARGSRSGHCRPTATSALCRAGATAAASFLCPPSPLLQAYRWCTTTAAATTSPATATSQSDEKAAVPPAVLRCIESGTPDLLRLLRCAAEDGTVVPAGRLEAAFRKQLDLLTLAQQEMAAATTPDRSVRSAVPSAWMAAVWAALARHCYVTLLAASSDARTDGGDGGRTVRQVGVLAFDWAAAMARVAPLVPYEGWTEQQLASALCVQHRGMERYPVAWLPRYGGADSLARFVRRRFPHLFVVTRSAVSGAPIVHGVGRNSVSPTWLPRSVNGHAAASSGVPRLSAACAGLQYALHTIGRGHQLPLWTDAEAVAPLLAATTGLVSPQPSVWRDAWVAHADLRDAFQLSGYVRVRAMRSAARLLVIVDTTTLDAAGAAALLEASAAVAETGAAVGAGTSVKLLRRGGVSATAAVQEMQETLTRTLGAAAVVDSVVVDALLEPQHMLGALLDAEVSGAEPSELRVALLCGAKGRAAFDAAVAEATPAGLPVTVMAPAAA